MRINSPITPTEYLLAAEDLLVSTTDLKGCITHCNPAFVECSGFSPQERIPAHRLHRHQRAAERVADLGLGVQRHRGGRGPLDAPAQAVDRRVQQVVGLGGGVAT